MSKNLTAQDISVGIHVVGLFSTPYILQDMVLDNPFTAAVQERVKTVLDLQGNLHGGMKPWSQVQQFNILPDGDDYQFFSVWLQQKKLYTARLAMVFPALNVAIESPKGFLISGAGFPSINEIFQPLEFSIEWSKIRTVVLPDLGN